MKTLTKVITTENGKETFNLRLTAGGQRNLKEKYDQESIALVMSAFNDTQMTIDILGVSLGYKGNDNSITDGEEFYDLLVDNGVCGAEGFAGILIDIAVNSGIVTKNQGNAVLKTVVKTMDEAFSDIDSIVAKEKDIEVGEKSKEKH